MDLDDVKNISVYGANCVVDISRGNDDTCRFVSAKEKNFRVEAVDGQLTVTQKSGNLLSRIIMRRIEFKLILPRSFNGRLRLRNKNGGLYLKGGELFPGGGVPQKSKVGVAGGARAPVGP